MSWSSFRSLTWQTVPMPYSTGSVSLARLPGSNQDFLAFVRFPLGWLRNQPVIYAATEEFVILEGELRIDDQRWVAPAYGCMAAGTVRHLTEAKPGCLAWARFHGSPRVAKLEAGTPTGAQPAPGSGAGRGTDGATDRPLAVGALPAPTLARSDPVRRLLRAFPESETWFDPAFTPADAHDGTRCDALDLDTFDGWSDASCPADRASDPATSRPRPAIVHRISETLR